MIHKMESQERGKQSLLCLALRGLYLSPTPSHILKLIKPVKALTSEMLRRINKSKKLSARARITDLTHDSDGKTSPANLLYRPHQPRNSTFRTLFLGLEAKETLREVYYHFITYLVRKYFSRSLLKRKFLRREEI